MIYRNYVILTITFIFTLVLSSCNSDNSTQEIIKGKQDIQFGLNINQSEDNYTKGISSIRIFIVDQHKNIIKNELFSNENNSSVSSFTLTDVPSGLFDIYVLGNELAIESVLNSNLDLNTIDNYADLMGLKTSGTSLHTSKYIPYSGVQKGVLIDANHKVISVPISRLISKFDITVQNRDDAPLVLTDVKIGNVMDASHFIYVHGMIQKSPNSIPLIISQEGQIEILPYESKNVALYFYQVSAFHRTDIQDRGFTLCFKGENNQVFEPVSLKDTDGNALNRIMPNIIYSLNVSIYQHKHIEATIEKLPWRRVNVEIPEFVR